MTLQFTSSTFGTNFIVTLEFLRHIVEDKDTEGTCLDKQQAAYQHSGHPYFITKLMIICRSHSFTSHNIKMPLLKILT